MSNYYQMDIKPLARGAAPDEGYERSGCATGDFQIRKRGNKDRVMYCLEELARNCFVRDPTETHILSLRYEKKKA